MMIKRSFLLALLASFLILPTRISGQQPEVVRVDAEPTCTTCRVEFDTIAVVGSLADSVLIPDATGGLVVAAGDTIVIGKHFLGPERNLVFAPNGTLVRTIGREGEGPGELLPSTIGLRPYDDSRVLVVQRGRLSVINLAGDVVLEGRAAWNMPPMVSVNPADGRVLYSNVQNLEGDDTGVRYELLGPELSRLRTFGRMTLQEQSACQLCRGRYTAWSQTRPDHVWSLPRNRNHVELWNVEGEHVLTLQVEGANWAPTLQDTLRTDPLIRRDGAYVAGGGRGDMGSTPPRPRFDAVHEDSEGLIWTTARVPAADWEPSPDPIPVPGSDVQHTQEQREYLSRTLDTVIQIIDPEAGEVVAVWRRDPNRVLVQRTGRHYAIQSQDDLGVISYTIVRARLAR